MKLFLVRHGRTNSEESGNRQSPDSVLSQTGELQASAVAKRLLKEEFEFILSSPWQRAKQTAQAIADEKKMEVKYSDLIREKEHDKQLYGARIDSEINQKYLKELSENFKDFDWKFLDGETYADTVKRAKEFRDILLKDYKEKSLLVVSHGLFLRSFIITCLFGDYFDKNIFMNLLLGTTLGCGSLSEVEYNEEKSFWQLISLNKKAKINLPQ